MKKGMRVFLTGLTFCFLFVSQGLSPRAEARPAYTYSLTLSSGSGVFTEGMKDSVTVNGSRAHVSGNENEIVIAGLHYGDAVQLNVQTDGAVSHPDVRYHVRGFRLSGRDEVVENNAAVIVKGNASYVVAYSVPGNQVAYTINYTDEAGTSLAPSQTFYGTVGDPISATLLNIAGYVPTEASRQLIQNTQLSEDSAANSFTFVYEPSPVTTTTNTHVETVTQTEEVVQTIGVQVNAPQPDNEGNNPPVEVIDDQTTPQGGGEPQQPSPQPEVIEEQETPQSGGSSAFNSTLLIAGAAGAALLLIGLFLWKSRQKKESEDQA